MISYWLLAALHLSSSYGFAQSTAEQQAQQSGQAQAQGTANSIVQNAANQVQTQLTPTNYPSFLQSSLNTHYNSLTGQTASLVMAADILGAADQTASGCTAPESENPSCYAAGALWEIGHQAEDYSRNFDSITSAAWLNICEFRNTGCNASLANPLSGLQSQAQQQIQINGQVAVKILESVGYTVNPKTGQVIKPDGTEINVSDEKRLKQQMGEERGSALLQQITTIKNAAEKKVKKFTFEKYLKALGLSSDKIKKYNPSSAQSSGNKKSKASDSAFEVVEPNPYNKVYGAYGKLKNPPSSEEMFILLDGQPIGVLGDDIFKMIQRQYQRQIKSHSFLKSTQNQK